MLVDSHCHINALSPEEKESLFSGSAQDSYVFIDSSIDLPTSLNSLTFSGWYDFIYSSLGFHPLCGKDYTPDAIKEYEQLIENNPKAVAVGEIGLDYKAPIPLSQQEQIFIAFIELAYRNKLPILIHNRFQQERLFQGGSPYILNVLGEIISSCEKVIFHCFSYGPRFLEKIIRKGGTVSFSLNILRNDPDILESLKQCPLDHLLLETDSPYMRVEGHSSTPLDIERVYDRAAEIKGVSRQELEQIVLFNAQRLFSLKPES